MRTRGTDSLTAVRSRPQPVPTSLDAQALWRCSEASPRFWPQHHHRIPTLAWLAAECLMVSMVAMARPAPFTAAANVAVQGWMVARSNLKLDQLVSSSDRGTTMPA
jgi:hypothetical protein